jgi:hypothetical protein
VGLKILMALLLFCVYGCASAPLTRDRLSGTTWAWVNQADGNKEYRLDYTVDTVTFTIYGSGRIVQEPVRGTYTVSGNKITENYGNYTAISEVKGNKMTDLSDENMIFVRK